MVGRQAEPPDFIGKTEPAEILHGPRLRGVGLGVEGGIRLLVDQQAAYATTPQLIGQHQAAGAAAGNQDVGLHHGNA